MISERAIGLEGLDDFEASLIDDSASGALPNDTAPPAGNEVTDPTKPISGAEPSEAGTGAAPPSGNPDVSTSKPDTPPKQPSPKTLPHERWVGKRLARFRLMKLLGSGSMGVVFQVEDIHLKRIGALKVLRKQLRGDGKSKQVERFLLEARAAAAIDAPNIAQVYEINTHNGWWYIALEFMEGGCLKTLVNNIGQVPVHRAALMFLDAARGLAAAHESGVIHRDIKPANLMLNRRGRCKLVDFGLVKLDSAEDPFRDDERFAGTPLYVAPEVIRKKGATAASDVYSLGASLYAVIAGRPPFVGKNVREVLEQQLKSEPPDIRDKAPDCPESIALLIQRSMSKDAAQRPSAEAFAAFLQAEVAVAPATDSALGYSPLPPGASPVPDGGRARTDYPSLSGSATVISQHIPVTAGSSVAPPPDPSSGSSGTSAAASRRGSQVGRRPTPGKQNRLGVWAAAIAGAGVIYAAAMLLMPRDPDNMTPFSPSMVSSLQLTDRISVMTNSIGQKLARIPAGRFRMGSPPNEPGRNSDERPVDVEITREFYMSQTEVTQAQWQSVMGDDYVPPEGIHPNDAGGLRFIGDTMPAYVSWLEAAEFCRILSAREDAHYRLPTEAEWEYACRAGSSTPFRVGETINPSQANIDGPATEADAPGPSLRPLPVASFPPNDWGLYDMHGNVMEWCADWMGEYPLGPLADPTGPATGTTRVIRGGSWDSYARVARRANRWFNYPVIRTDYIGFRVVLVPDEPPPGDVGPLLPRRPPAVAWAVKSVLPHASVAVSNMMAEVDADLPTYVPESILDQRLRSVGSDTMDWLMRLWETEFLRYHRQVEFRHEGKGSGTAIPSLAEGISHFGPMSRPLKPAERSTFLSEYGYEPTQVPVAIDAVAIYVHHENPIARRGLTLAELDAIYSSTRVRGCPRELSVWGDLGVTGKLADQPIHVYSRNSASGTYGVFKKETLLGGEYKTSNYELVGSAELLEAVANDPLSIGYSGIGYNRWDVEIVPLAVEDGGPMIAPDPATASDGSYPLARYLYLTMNMPPRSSLSPLHSEFLRFVYSAEGQETVVMAGYFPMTSEHALQQLTQLGLAQDGLAEGR